MVIFTNCGLLYNKPTSAYPRFPWSVSGFRSLLALILLLPSLRYDLFNPVSISQWSQELCLWCLGEHRWCCQFMERVPVPGAWVLVTFKALFSFTVWADSPFKVLHGVRTLKRVLVSGADRGNEASEMCGGQIWGATWRWCWVMVFRPGQQREKLNPCCCLWKNITAFSCQTLNQAVSLLSLRLRHARRIPELSGLEGSSGDPRQGKHCPKQCPPRLGPPAWPQKVEEHIS